MLTWFVGQHAAKSALIDHILTEKDVKFNPTSVSAPCLDENISIRRIKQYFTTKGWKAVLNTWEKANDE